VTGLLALALIAGSGSLVPEGRAAPLLEAQTLDGRAWSDRLTGEVTIVEFFATWCPRCRHSLVDTHKLAGARQVRLIIVDVDEDPALVQLFFAQHPPPANVGVLVDQSGGARANWGVTGFPSIFVVDKTGVIRERWAGWGDGSLRELVEAIDAINKPAAPATATATTKPATAAGAKPAAGARQPAGGRRRRGKAPPPSGDRTLSPDEHARQIGVEVIR
jgi:cytochrome c biogenesis protein CcmG/thiol:disulfide interchange protein DsbE